MRHLEDVGEDMELTVLNVRINFGTTNVSTGGRVR